MAWNLINPIIGELIDLIESPRVKDGTDVSHATDPSRARRIGQISARLLIVALILLALAPAVVQASPAQAASEANAAKPSVACPSQDFNEFMAAFSESVDLQRRYTLLPLQYGDYVAMPGSAIKWRKIKKIEDIPYFDPDTQLLFRNNDQRAEKNLDVNIEHQSDGQLNEVVIFQKEAGYGGYAVRYYFYFAKDRCWHLYAVKHGA
jgi:hypothetical protein